MIWEVSSNVFFSELYGAYYTAVAKIIRKAIESPLDINSIREIIEENAFGESTMNIESSLLNEKWQLITKEGKTPIVNQPTLPQTNLEKSWLKAISLDPRMKLFTEDFADLEDVQPLFTPEDIYIFDKYADGDPYEDEQYRNNFKLILDAIQKKYPLKIKSRTRSGRELYAVLMPEYLEYSEKDDKFRLIGSGRKYGDTVNLARIVSCVPYTKEYTPNPYTRMKGKKGTVEFELVDQRNALERVLMHFAHFEKQAERIADNRYLVKVTYNKDDETEMLIRILSFGPMIKVVGPDQFVNLIKERLLKQKSCGH